MKESKVLKRVSHVAVIFCLAVICVAVVKTTGQEENSGGDGAVDEGRGEVHATASLRARRAFHRCAQPANPR